MRVQIPFLAFFHLNELILPWLYSTNQGWGP